MFPQDFGDMIVMVPLAFVLAVHKPSRLGDSTARTAWSGMARRVVPQVEELPL